jgi:predicted flap endonuclease-1-like 5' DNA nuclease
MDLEYMDIWCWLIPIAVGLICGFFGYLIGRGSNPTVDFNSEIKSLKQQNEKTKADLAKCEHKLAAGSALNNDTVPPFDAAEAKNILGKAVKFNDLSLVEGIGPKIRSLFHNFEIKTWQDLSETSVAKCQEVLDSGGDRYKVHDPASWPMQAKMAAEGKWKDLAKWQHKHKHGKL